MTYNWNSTENYTEGRNFGHLAFEVENIYQICEKLQKAGIVINRPPEMVGWHLYVHQTISQLNCCKRVMPSKVKNRGNLWEMLVIGNT